MNFKKVEKATKKINQLLDNMKDEEHVNKIEKDLLLSYIRDLYEKVIYTEESSKKTTTKSSSHKEMTKNQIADSAVKVVAPTPPPSAVEIADVVRQEIKENTYQHETPLAVKHAETHAFSQNDIIHTSKEETASPSNNNAPVELLELFEAVAVSELSDKLSRSPISNLSKCMGINERIFTVNELFGGDTGLFNSTMQELDKFNSLEQARDYLVNNVAVAQNWGEESKLKKTANFVKLISRRY
ncbi:MAG: hypothetical protein ACJA1A_000621 [Saprospiraceae bacterium]|jgi:hypothetical protein